MLVNIKILYSMLMQVATQFFQNWKTFEKHENFSKNMIVESTFHVKSLRKLDHFPKSHIYSERGSCAASAYDKNSTSIFLWNVGFSKGGASLKLLF
jgi:hypothetical protein